MKRYVPEHDGWVCTLHALPETHGHYQRGQLFNNKVDSPAELRYFDGTNWKRADGTLSPIQNRKDVYWRKPL